jgi:nitrite reductase (NADH) large subunit
VKYGIATLERPATGTPVPAAGVTAPFETIVIIGNGMVGHRLCRRLFEHGVTGTSRVIALAEERVPAYDRVHLTDAFSGRDERELWLADIDWYVEHGIELHLGDPAVAIDRDRRMVCTAAGREFAFTRLVLATGAAPYVPPIDGADLPGVFRYRALSDVQAIRAAATGARSAAVIGGGLLGLEAARALQQMGLAVTVVEAAAGLMPAQLDQESGAELERQVRAGGIEVRTATITRRIVPAAGQHTLHFATGSSCTVGVVVIATGVRPRSELAAGCQLARTPDGGVVVDDRLQTSDPHIYAIGDCAAHRAHAYGLVAPGFEMADVLASNLAGGTASFRGTSPTVRLKMLGVQVVSAGEPLTGGDVIRYRSDGVSRLVRIERGRIVGALGVGAWDDFTAIQEAAVRRRRVWPWQRGRFARTGRLWEQDDALPATTWDPQAVICNCMNVTRGHIDRACAGMPVTVNLIMARTGASTLCGSCRPLLEHLAQPDAWQRPRVSAPLLIGSVAALVAAFVVIVMTPIPFADTFDRPFRIDVLWRNGVYRQVTGFTLLGLALLASLLSVRKRWRWTARLGAFSNWRLVHVVLGVLTLITLAVHTGARVGDNLNLVLMAAFSAVNIVGGLAGSLTAIEQRMGTPGWRRARAALVAAHLLAMWPLPLLIAFHVLSAYYF